MELLEDFVIDSDQLRAPNFLWSPVHARWVAVDRDFWLRLRKLVNARNFAYSFREHMYDPQIPMDCAIYDALLDKIAVAFQALRNGKDTNQFTTVYRGYSLN